MTSDIPKSLLEKLINHKKESVDNQYDDSTKLINSDAVDKKKITVSDKSTSFDDILVDLIADDADSQFKLGACYCYGNGVEQDYGKAVFWFKKAAEQGNAEAQYELGGCYTLGDGVEKDIDSAISWYKKALEQGYEQARGPLEDLLDYVAEAENDK